MITQYVPCLSSKAWYKNQNDKKMARKSLQNSLDTSKGTMELTERKKERIIQIFNELRDKKCVGIKKWHRVLGELRFMGAADPSAAGLFRAMQLGLTHSEKNCVRITPYLRDHLMDFKMLAHSMTR